MTDLRPDQPADPADPLEERRRIEEAFAPLPQCPRCGAQVPAWSLATVRGEDLCQLCATTEVF